MPDDPDPTATELARVVAWLRARAARYHDKSRQAYDDERLGQSMQHSTKAALLQSAADALERGEKP